MTSLQSNRKGQQQLGINSIGAIAMAILIGVVIMGLGGTVLQKIQETQSDNTASTNETITWTGNNTNMSLVQSRINTGSIILYNNGSIVNKGTGDNANYSAGESFINIINTSGINNAGGPKGVNGSDWITSDLNVSYSYLIGSQARNTTGFGLTGILTFSEFVPTIAIIAAAAIVIGILLLFFGRRRQE